MVGVAGVVLWWSLGVLRGDGDDWARRGSPALAWTGDQLFVYGGTPVPRDTETVRSAEPLGSAALIDPESGDVDTLPEAPFDRALAVAPAAVAVGDEVFVVGAMCREAEEDVGCPAGGYRAAAYSIPDDEWREVDIPDPLQLISNGQSEAVGMTSDGRAVVVLGSREGFGAIANRQIWTYSPADDEWEMLPAPGGLIEGVCLAGDVVVVGSGLLADTAAGVAPVLRVRALDSEASGWIATEPAQAAPVGEAANLTCGEDLVLFDDDETLRQVFDFGTGGGWRATAEAPGDDTHASRLWTGEEFLFLDPTAPNLAYDPVADTWRGIEGSAPSGVNPVWTGDAVVAWPGRTDTPVTFEVTTD